ncbi:MAG: hypothetical protein ABII71_02245 [Candidatus Micrarchaeota archaeon]
MHKPPSSTPKGEKNGRPSDPLQKGAMFQKLREIARKRIEERRDVPPSPPTRFQQELKVFVEEVRRGLREPPSSNS